MTSRFAESTSVSVERSRAELEALLGRYGATQRLTFIDDEQGRAVVQFRAEDRVVRLEMAIPSRASLTPAWGSPEAPRGSWRWPESVRNEWISKRMEQAARSAWRRLLLVTKAKFEIIAEGGSTVEREFLADIMLADGRSVHAALKGELEKNYLEGGITTKLLGSGG